MSTPQQLVAKLWSYCNVLRDVGLFYGDYLEQLMFLLFLKTADEGMKLPFNRSSSIPEDYGWSDLVARSGGDPENHYRRPLKMLAR